MPEGNIEKTHMSLKSVAILVFFSISFTGAAVTAWMTVVHAAERAEYINARVDKKTGRNAEDIKALEDRVFTLELPDSDAATK
jgi:hypothetical protein